VVAVRLAEDERARVPFALVGALLLVGAASYAAALAHRPPPAERPNAVAAMNRVDGTVATTVHRSTKRAARAAARAPVLEPADTAGGRVLRENGTFRDYLRLRIYLAVREDLANAAVTVGDAEAVPSLPATPDAEALQRAKRQVHVVRVDGGLHVTVENVTVRLRVDGRVLEVHNRTVVRTVATPVLAVHDRVRRFERRLNRGPGEGPGLGRRLTARMNAIAWTRGYAQYGGAPISNVVTNRHVELQANGALLSVQRAVFGRSDPAGRRATTRATAIVGATDVLMGGLTKADTADVLPHRPGAPTTPRSPKPPPPARPPSAAQGNVTVGVDLTADEAFTAFVSDDEGTTLDRTVGSVYGADVRIVGARHTIASSTEQPNGPPGTNWTLVGNRTTKRVTVGPSAQPGPTPEVAGDWHRLATHTKRVTVVETTHRQWARGTGGNRQTQTTNSTDTRTMRVTVAVVGRHAQSAYAPRNGIAVVHERGGPLEGPNLLGVPTTARDRVRRQYGRPSQLVRHYVNRGPPNGTLRVAGERPEELRAWLIRDLAQLRERVRAISVTVPRTRLGAGEVNPAAVLAQRLAHRRSSLVDAPATYGSVPAKARVAARGAYLAVVVDLLEERARKARQTRSAFDEALAEHGLDPSTLSASLDAGATTDRPAAHPVATGGPLESLNASVSATPAYLTLSGVTHERLPAVPAGERYHPLVARNVNLFTVPYGDAADGVVSNLFDDPGRTSLAAAARTLQSTNRALDREYDPALARRRDELRGSVRRSLAYLRGRLVTTLVVAPGIERSAARAAVQKGFGRWETPAARAIAATNGSLAPAVAQAATRRLADPDGTRRELLTARLRVAVATGRRKNAARPRQPVVNRSASATRRATKEALKGAIEQGSSIAASTLDRKLGEKVSFPPAGLPIAPVPGYWYVTTNVWTVTARGEYLRFAVSAPSATPGRSLTYRREQTTVALDWDGDGERERLGRSTRVSFDVSTGVMVVVPPNPPGVGDRGGNADERSAGWPRPGNATAE
jgi:hypothetical protein